MTIRAKFKKKHCWQIGPDVLIVAHDEDHAKRVYREAMGTAAGVTFRRLPDSQPLTLHLAAWPDLPQYINTGLFARENAIGIYYAD